MLYVALSRNGDPRLTSVYVVPGEEQGLGVGVDAEHTSTLNIVYLDVLEKARAALKLAPMQFDDHAPANPVLQTALLGPPPCTTDDAQPEAQLSETPLPAAFAPQQQGQTEDEIQLPIDQLPCDFNEDMIDVAAWNAEIHKWHSGVQPWLAAHEQQDPSELEDGDLLEFAAMNTLPGTFGWASVYADHIDDFEMCR